MYSGTDHKYTEPGGSLRGKLLGALVLLGGHLEPILGPFAGPTVLFALFLGQCHPFLLPKKALMPFYQIQ